MTKNRLMLACAAYATYKVANASYKMGVFVESFRQEVRAAK